MIAGEWYHTVWNQLPQIIALGGFLGGIFGAIYKVLRKLDKLDKLDKIENIVLHHLGTNGDTPPLWRRMERLEMAHEIETPAMPDAMRERYPRDGSA